MSLAITLEGLHKSYGKTHALNDVSVNIQAGETHALVGPNGSGKSTLIWALTGRIRLDAGAIIVDGQAIDRMTPALSKSLGIELVPQELALVPGFEVWENILLGDETGSLRVSKQEGRRIARRVLDDLGLDIGVDEETYLLDPGEQRLVMFARTFHRNAKMIIFDEPTAGLGEDDSRIVMTALDRLKARGLTMLFVSHYLGEVDHIADRASIMRDGVVCARLEGPDLNIDRLVSEMSGLSVPSNAPRREADDRAPVLVEGRHLAMPPLRQLNFKLRERECLGFAGLLGSGREKVIDTISGAVRLWGSVRVKGEFIDNPREALAAGMGNFNGDRSLAIVPGWSVEKHVTLPILERLSNRLFIDRRLEEMAAQQALRSLNVKAQRGDELSELSGGNQQRALLSRWLMANTEVLLIDEPCLGVDIAARAELLDAIRKYSVDHAVAMASSDPLDLVECCTRVLCLRKGVVVKELVGDEITEEAIVRATATGIDVVNEGEAAA